MTITGGLHADGFMDTMDAIHSYQPKERKLEILKDSLIGAFAVIMLAVYGLICLGALSEIGTKELQKLVCSGFFLSRCLSGISAVSFPLAKKDGMLFLFADASQKRIVKGSEISAERRQGMERRPAGQRRTAKRTYRDRSLSSMGQAKSVGWKLPRRGGAVVFAS